MGSSSLPSTDWQRSSAPSSTSSPPCRPDFRKASSCSAGWRWRSSQSPASSTRSRRPASTLSRGSRIASRRTARASRGWLASSRTPISSGGPSTARWAMPVPPSASLAAACRRPVEVSEVSPGESPHSRPPAASSGSSPWPRPGSASPSPRSTRRRSPRPAVSTESPRRLRAWAIRPMPRAPRSTRSSRRRKATPSDRRLCSSDLISGKPLTRWTTTPSRRLEASSTWRSSTTRPAPSGAFSVTLRWTRSTNSSTTPIRRFPIWRAPTSRRRPTGSASSPSRWKMLACPRRKSLIASRNTVASWKTRPPRWVLPTTSRLTTTTG